MRTITLDEKDLSTFTSEILTYEALTGHEVKNAFVRTHGYYEYKHNFIPIVCGSVAGVILLAVGVPLLVKAGKKRKKEGK